MYLRHREPAGFGLPGARLGAGGGLWIASLPPLAPDPSNAYADNPEAARLGQRWFFDARFSSNGQVACATCHLPDRQFQDGLPLARGVGLTTRRTMTVVGTAYSRWLFWDGRKDSQWGQALGPLESPVEHGGTRTQYAHLIAEHYQSEYKALFGPLPDLSRLPASAGPVADAAAAAACKVMAHADREAVTRLYANMGKAIAAYERLLLPGPSRFDADVEAVLADDRAGMEAKFSTEEGAGLRFLVAGDPDLARKFRPPSLRNVAERAPYMHAGQFATLEAVLAHYNRAPAAPARHSELEPLHLSARETAQLIAFLRTLSGPVAAAGEWLTPPGD